MNTNLLFLIIILVLLLLSAFFSGSETALFSYKRSELYRYSLSCDKNEKLIYRMMHDPDKILITILTGNMLVNLFISNLTTNILLKVFPDYGQFVSILIVTPMIIVFCEILPKIFAINEYDKMAKRVIRRLQVFHYLFIPFRLLFLQVTNLMIKVFHLKLTHDDITEEELNMAVAIGEREGVLKGQEKSYIQNVLTFSKQEASNIMIPRTKAYFLAKDTSIEDALEYIKKVGVVRFPIFEGDLDHIIGVIDSRDLLPYSLGYKKAKNINKIIQPIPFFPATKELGSLLTDFLENKLQIAVAVDEYGGTAGIVTLDSMLTELIGHSYVNDGFKRPEDIEKVDNDKYLVLGELQIHEFNRLFDCQFDDSEYDTIAGFVIAKFEHLPKQGDSLQIEKFLLTIEKISDNQILQLGVKIKEDTDE